MGATRARRSAFRPLTGWRQISATVMVMGRPWLQENGGSEKTGLMLRLGARDLSTRQPRLISLPAPSPCAPPARPHIHHGGG